MKHRYVLLSVIGLLMLAFPVFAGQETSSGPARTAREASEEEADAESKALKAVTTTTVTKAAESFQESSYKEPKPATVFVPSLDISPASVDGGAPAASWTLALKPDRKGEGGRKGKGKGKGGHGGWKPPPRAPHGRRGKWRRDRYHHWGTWHFLVFGGPRVYYPQYRRTSHVVRVQDRRNGIYIRQTGDDALGRSFASSVRARLREHGFKVVYDDDESAIELFMVSMEDDPEDPGWGSAVSISYISNPGQRFITSQMIDVGDEQVDELAELVAEYVDELADDYNY